jgi:hypothetical protein
MPEADDDTEDNQRAFTRSRQGDGVGLDDGSVCGEVSHPARIERDTSLTGVTLMVLRDRRCSIKRGRGKSLGPRLEGGVHRVKAR